MYYWRQFSQIKQHTMDLANNNIALFIDFENFPDVKSFDAFKLISKLKERGRIILKKAYADWGRYAGSKRQMLENSIELIEMPSHTLKGKNSSDIKLVVDALETAIYKSYINIFVVVAGDSDYTPLISKLRELDKYVIVVSHEKTMSTLLKGFCDEIYQYKIFVGEVKDLNKSQLTAAYSLLSRAIANLKNKGTKTFSSNVKGYLIQLDSSFDEQAFGFQSWKDFCIKANEDKIIRIERSESGDYILHNFTDQPSKTKAPINQLQSEDKGIGALIYWALKACSNGKPDVELSELGNCIKYFDPVFSFQKYGYTQIDGYKKILLDLQAKGMLTYKVEGVNPKKYFISLATNFDERKFIEAKPSNFDDFVEENQTMKETSTLKTLLHQNGYYFEIGALLGYVTQIKGLLSEMINPISAQALIQEFQKMQIAKISEKSIAAIFKTLLESNCFLDANNKVVITNDSNTIVEIESVERIELNVIKLISDKAKELNKGESVNQSHLHYILYKETI